MKIASIAAGVFLAAFILHLVIWRIRMPRRQTAALLVIFCSVLLAALIANLLAPSPPLGFWAAVHVSIFHVAMTLAYVVGYSAIEERSPSMTLVTFVAATGETGAAREELLAILRGFDPLESRLRAMLRDGMIVDAGDVYALATKGRQWAGVLSFWRRLLGRDKGG